MRRLWLALTLAASVGGCDLGMDLDGLGAGFSCTDCWTVGGGGGTGGGGGGGTADEVAGYHGRISIGPYGVAWGEATVYVYAPTNLDTPVDSATLDFGGYIYRVRFGPKPPPAVCGYLVRMVLWNGDSSELAPLLPTPPASCDSLPPSMATRDLSLAYAPLDTPFALEGAVFIDGVPAPAGVRVDISTRSRDPEPSCPWGTRRFLSARASYLSVAPPSAECVPVHTDAAGHYAYATTDPAQVFVLCRLAIAQVRLDDDTTLQTQLEHTPLSACDRRRLPDVRYGSRVAARGAFRLGSYWADTWVGAGEAYVEILDPSGSTTVGERSWTLADGTFHLWLPHNYDGSPPCDLLLRATLVGGGSETRPLRRWEGPTCSEDAAHHVFDLAAQAP